MCLVILSVWICFNIFDYADAEHTNIIMEEFYAQDDNTADVIYFGASGTQRSYIIPKAFNDYGIAAYSIASGTQPFVLTKYLMEEAQKTQSPKLFVVDLRRTCDDKDSLWDVAVRRVVDNMKLSSNKVKAVKAVIEFAEGGENNIDETGWSYYVPFLKYHDRWNPSKQPKYSENIDYYKGYTMDWGVCFKATEVQSLPYSDDTARISKESEKALNDLLDYCDDLDVEVLFVASPYESSEYGMERINYSQKICEERGYTVLNFLSPEKKAEIGLDDRYCYYNREHLNFYGSNKYTDYLSKYFKAHYDIPDRRGDERYESWAKEYDRLMNNLDTTYSKKYSKLMSKIEKIQSGEK